VHAEGGDGLTQRSFARVIAGSSTFDPATFRMVNRSGTLMRGAADNVLDRAHEAFIGCAAAAGGCGCEARTRFEAPGTTPRAEGSNESVKGLP
jgi:hypothetical protein